ncbi:acyl-CoA dehydrogenase family protein [Salirhabdus salicampi]|uniref:acyl-CoA dehydrogenase family protein n=1 Tax=Salirhabdus salicampi TaxID=476102 RepID=UPI0020C3AD05|nr:acyl-CoA dehydrogenase family protein [Salirhabdus salicampi]MCP8615659.1 acyl-CoA dehydrogenase family protein [Salirhabdus salicampi]
MNQKLFNITDEQEMLVETIRDITEKEFKPNSSELEQSGEFPFHNMKILGDLGILGISIPEEYGGSDGTVMDAVLILEEIAKGCYITGMAVLGEIGVQSKAIVAYGSEEQKQKYLPGIAKGETILAICITESEVGSDAGNMKTNSTLEGNSYIVNGTKQLISRADVADLFLVFTRFEGEQGSQGVGCLLVEKGTPGLHVRQGYQTMGGEYLWEVEFDNCAVPIDNVLVRENGFKKLMTAFNTQRCLNASITLGLAEGAFNEALKYTKEREQFGRPVANFQGIQWMLSDMYVEIEASKSLLYRAAINAGKGFPDKIEASVAKLYTNEMAIRVTNQAMQLHGGYGYTKEYPVERMVRGARFGALGGGTSQIQKNLIGRHLLKTDKIF